jgi:hypothetical protein
VATFAETVSNKLRYLLGTNKPSTIAEGFLALAEDVDTKMASYSQGTLAGRPAAGQSNRFYRATDTGELFHDTGAAWERLTGLEALTPQSVSHPVGAIVVFDGVPYETGEPFYSSRGTEYEPSKTRPTLVYLDVESSNVWTVEVGGVVILEAQSNVYDETVVFIVPAGKKWKYNNGAAEGRTAYQAL